MPLHELGRLRLFQFDTLPSDGLIHGIFTRHGGLSPDPWASLNVGAGVGDDPERVRGNRSLALQALGRSPESVFDVWQVHSAEVVVARRPRGQAPPQQADAIVTDRPQVTLLMRFADCVPILLFDPVRHAVGVVHAGWLGTVRRTTTAAVRTMVKSFGTHPSDLWAGLGPSIAAHHYPVGAEVVAALRESLGEEAERHLSPSPSGTRLDLWSANSDLLRAEGVGTIEVSGVCTACATQDWYSHRGEGGRTGRFGALLGLRG
jgi:hypothetical protein